MHLAGQADSAYFCPGLGCLGAQLSDGGLQGQPPAVGVLLAPGRVGALHGERGAGAGVDAVSVVQQQQLQARSAQVNAEVHGGVLVQNGWPPGDGIRWALSL